jgi:ligand-binding SRPBCC domain-containing protein
MNYVKETRLRAAPSDVFAWHEIPGAFEKLLPSGQQVEIVERASSLRPGSRVVLRVKIGPVWKEWIAEHTEYEPPHLFADRQVKGPFAKWYHRHRFLDDGAGGTILREEVEYEVPGGWLGKMAIGGRVAAELEKLFAHRHAVMKELFGAG